MSHYVYLLSCVFRCLPASFKCTVVCVLLRLGLWMGCLCIGGGFVAQFVYLGSCVLVSFLRSFCTLEAVYWSYLRSFCTSVAVYLRLYAQFVYLGSCVPVLCSCTYGLAGTPTSVYPVHVRQVHVMLFFLLLYMSRVIFLLGTTLRAHLHTSVLPFCLSSTNTIVTASDAIDQYSLLPI